MVAEAAEAGDRTVMGSLVAALREGNPRVRESAAEALAALGDRDAVIPLAGLLGDPDWEVRLAAASTLCRIGSSAMDLMTTLLREGNRNVRAGVANLLGKLQAAEAVDPLMQALDDSGRLVRANAAVALGRIGESRAVNSLIHSMQDPDRGVRNNAAAALCRIGTPEALATVRDGTGPWPDVGVLLPGFLVRPRVSPELSRLDLPDDHQVSWPPMRLPTANVTATAIPPKANWRSPERSNGRPVRRPTTMPPATSATAVTPRETASADRPAR